MSIDLKNSTIYTSVNSDTVFFGADANNATVPKLYAASAVADAIGTITDSTNTLGLQPYSSSYTNVTYTGSTPNQAIRFAKIDSMTYNTSASNSGAGHVGGHLARIIRTGTGDPGLMLASEDKIENNATGTVSLAKGREIQLAANVGTITFYAGLTSQILANSGTVTTAVLHDADVASNTGTITTLIDFWSRDVSSISGITAKYGFRQDDPAKLNVSATSWIDQSTQYATPTNGGTTNISANVAWLILQHGATIASHTIAFPAAPTIPHGYVFEITTTQEITALTLTCSGSTFIVWSNGTTLNSGQNLRFRWDAANGWLRSMSAY